MYGWFAYRVYSPAFCGWNADTGNWHYPTPSSSFGSSPPGTQSRLGYEIPAPPASAPDRGTIKRGLNSLSTSPSALTQSLSKPPLGAAAPSPVGTPPLGRNPPAVSRALNLDDGDVSNVTGPPPEPQYVCQACYPSPKHSMKLGKRNLSLFRLHNTSFDMIGGVLYFLIVVSVRTMSSQSE